MLLLRLLPARARLLSLRLIHAHVLSCSPPSLYCMYCMLCAHDIFVISTIFIAPLFAWPRCSVLQLGTTLDDSVGEAFDKVARLLGIAQGGCLSVVV